MNTHVAALRTALVLFASAPMPADAQTSPPRPLDKAGWISTVDYPPGPALKGEDGKVQYSLAIKANGKVASCKVTTSSGFPDLDKDSCTLVRSRAHFAPATKDGGTVPSQFEGSITWHTGRPIFPVFATSDYPPEALQNGSVGIVYFTLFASRDGKPTTCVVTLSSSYSSLDKATCDIMMSRTRLPWIGDPTTDNKEVRFFGAINWQTPKTNAAKVTITLLNSHP